MMEVSKPRRILTISLEAEVGYELLCKFIRDLTGSTPNPVYALAGSSHTLDIKTTYYTASIPIWLDLVSDASLWSADFLSEEAKEVLAVLGALVVVFPLPASATSDEAKASRELIRQAGKVINDGLGGWSWDGVALCLGVGELDDVDEWEDLCADSCLEFVQVRGRPSDARNEFGEKTGMARAREALEANDWEQADDDDDDDLRRDLGLDPFLDAAHHELDGLQSEGILAEAGAGSSGHGGPEGASPGASPDDGRLDEDEVDKIEGMMRKLVAVRDTSAGLPEDRRRRMAARAVNEVMKDL